jgi:hypothetical protein
VLRVEWDLDGDGQFDTAPTTTKTFNLALPINGNRYILARITDPSNSTAISAPLALHAHRPFVEITRGQVMGTTYVSWTSKLGFVYRPQRATNLQSWVFTDVATQLGNGAVLQQPFILPGELDSEFYRIVFSRANE